MIFDKDTIIKGVKQQLSPSEKNKKEGINIALNLCLDDLTMRLASASMITSYTVSIAQGDRTANLTGESNDLRYIFGVKYGTGSSQGYLEYTDPTEFLKKYDSPTAGQSQPSRYTQLVSVDGFPQIKFNVPASAATTITVYFYSDVTSDNVHKARSSSTVVNGTIAYFHGIGSTKGKRYYEVFEHLAKLALASDSFKRPKDSRFIMSKADEDIKIVQLNFRGKRA